MFQIEFDYSKSSLRRNADKARYGGDKAWRQHRGDGENSGIVERRKAQERHVRSQMQEEEEGDDLELSSISISSVVEDDEVPFEAAPRDGAFDTSCGERHLALDVGADFDAHVFLRYGAAGKLASAHCRLHRRNLWDTW